MTQGLSSHGKSGPRTRIPLFCACWSGSLSRRTTLYIGCLVQWYTVSSGYCTQRWEAGSTNVLLVYALVCVQHSSRHRTTLLMSARTDAVQTKCSAHAIVLQKLLSGLCVAAPTEYVRVECGLFFFFYLGFCFRLSHSIAINIGISYFNATTEKYHRKMHQVPYHKSIC